MLSFDYSAQDRTLKFFYTIWIFFQNGFLKILPGIVRANTLRIGIVNRGTNSVIIV